MKLPKWPHRYVIYDKLHRGSVFILVSAAFITMARMVFDMGHYTMVRRPRQLEEKRLAKEAQMEQLQAEKERELVKQRQLQQDASEVSRI